MNIKFVFVLLLIFAAKISTISAQDALSMADTVIIGGDTLIMLGDSLIFTTEEEPTYWKRGGNFNLSLQQVSLSNWAAGGASSFALNTGLQLFANYKKENIIWDTNLTINYGINRQTGRAYPTRKSNDNFIFISKYGRQLSKTIYLSTQIDARTQLIEGYRYYRESGADRDSRSRLSDFLSPGYVQSSTGLNYQTTSKNGAKFSSILSPFTGRFTVVLDDSLSNAGAFGVVPGEKVKPEAGISLNTTADFKVMENVSWKMDLNLFTNYEKLGNTVVNFNSVISLKVNKYITTRIATIMIYDESVYVPQDEGPATRAIQLQNLINFGIGLDF